MIHKMFKKAFSTLDSCSRRLSSLNQRDGKAWIKHEKILMEPFEYAQKLPCKHHNIMAPAFNHWLQVPEQSFKSVQDVCRACISWSILLDDIQDDSLSRYGAPATHQVYGVGVTINAANKTLFKIQNQMMELGHSLAPQIFQRRIEEYLHGQGIDLYWQDKHICPSEDLHIEMTKYKLGAYFVLPVELLQLFSSNKTDYSDLAINIGSYYELIDDYYNLFSPKALPRLAHTKQEKPLINSDIKEGKKSLAIIHALQYPDVATELTDILKQRTTDPKLHIRAISLLKKHGSDEYVRVKLREMENDIRSEIDRLGGNPMLTSCMDEFSFKNYEPEL